jgi:hypothetical protein
MKKHQRHQQHQLLKCKPKLLQYQRQQRRPKFNQKITEISLNVVGMRQ